MLFEMDDVTYMNVKPDNTLSNHWASKLCNIQMATNVFYSV